ncbi:MAG: LysR family transcriptional regulator [Pseudomonadota bacterium]
MHIRVKAAELVQQRLEDFSALAATGNFSRAADERHMTQPAFGRRIRALEEWIGAELFDRRSQPVRLTETGLWFQGVAQDLLSQVARLPGEARAISEATSNSLRFAATHALSFTFMPGWLRSFEAHTMAGTIQLESDVLLRCEELIEQSKVQFVVCHAHAAAGGRLEAEGYPFIQIGADVLVPVSAAGSDGKPLISMGGEKKPVPLLGYSVESGLGRILREAHLEGLQNTPTQTVFTAHLASVLRTMVLQERGIAWLPQSLIQEDLASKRIAHAGPPGLSVALEIRLYRSRNAMGKAAEALWEAVVGSEAGG